MPSRKEQYAQRVLALKAFDDTFACASLAGMDEAGRGPLVGDVVAACVIMPNTPLLPRVDDSKKLSEKVREEIAEQIKALALFVGVGKASPQEIDELNILNATRLAMQRAAQGVPAELMLVDAVKHLNFPFPVHSLIKGDAQSYVIACASVIAKTARDADMRALHEKYPQYSFLQNKGYGTKAHIEALKAYGACPEHRKSFIKNFVENK